MTIDQNTIRSLRGRGIEFKPPAKTSNLARLESAYSTTIGEDFRSFYSLADGFVVHDGPSMLMLWGVDQIIAAKSNCGSAYNCDGFIPIGDYLIDSDVVAARISDRLASVRLLYEGRDLAPSISDFLVYLAAGRFDAH